MRQTEKIRNNRLVQAIQRAASVLLVAHIAPDGDAVGSLLACGRVFSSLGKQVTMALADPVPEKYSFLPGADAVVDAPSLSGRRFDLGLALDCGDAGRMGGCADAYFACDVTAQLDHHATNPGFAVHNEVDGRASSTGCILWRLMGALHVEADAETALCIYCAISTDTGNFCFPSTDEETLLCASEMRAAGFDLGMAARRIHLIRETAHVRLLGRALATLRFFAGGSCTSMRLNAADYAAAGAGNEHCDGIVNYGINLPGVKMAYLLDERPEGIVKVSFRAVRPYDVASIASALGGGGHRLAAGLRTAGDAEAVAAAIERAMAAQIGEAMA